VIDWVVTQVEREGDFRVELVCIPNWKVNVLLNKSTRLVKGQWTCYGPEDAMWEHNDAIWENYPQIFEIFEER
jgi:hypothetical protein